MYVFNKLRNVFLKIGNMVLRSILPIDRRTPL